MTTQLTSADSTSSTREGPDVAVFAEEASIN